ncbi:MAG: NUDIX hydrolase [Umezawaea sp.]
MHTPTAHLTADMVVIGHDPTGTPSVLLIERGHAPFAGHLALPGGYVEDDETFQQAAVRELAEETGVTVDPDHLHQIGVYDTPDRDPRGRVVSTAYLAVVPDRPIAVAADDATMARWVRLDPLARRTSPRSLAFDHATILAAAVALFTTLTR